MLDCRFRRSCRSTASRSLLTLAALCTPLLAAAQGTRQWTVTRFEDFERGTPQNIAIRSDGRLEAAPALKPLASTTATYLWSVLPERNGSVLAGTGAATGGSQILRIDSKGTSSKVAEFKEQNVQALAMLPDASVLAATSPDGKLYRIANGGKPEVLFDPSTTAEKPKYLWSLAVEKSGDILVAAGAPAVIYRVSMKPVSKPQVLFHSGDQHIRTLLLASDGTLYAGSDGAGIVYRITADGKAFALYAAPKHEITSLALDPAGNLYAAAVGDRRPPALPPLPAQGEPRISVTFQQPGSSLSASTNALVPDGSEVYRIAPDGTPLKLLTLRDDIAYALSFRNGSLLVATGNRGHIYRVNPNEPGRSTDIAHVDANQAVALAPTAHGIVIATANSGKVAELSDAPANDSTYISEVFDAEIAAMWGRAEITGSPQGVELFARSGNVENVRSGLGDLWSDWKPVAPNQTPLPAPVARYMQWKAVLHPGARLDAVTINYLPRNLPPVIEDFIVQSGARLPAASPAVPSALVPVAFKTTSGSASPTPEPQTPGPLLAQRDRTAVTARWLSRDPNNDDLMFALYFRDVRETAWHLLKDHLSERAYSFDCSLLPDGEYELRVIASDAPVHVDNDTLTAERISAPFTIDTTPPIPGTLTATLRDGKLNAEFEAHDATSPISHAEFSVDAGPWQYLEPVGKLSDSLSERYSLHAPVQGTGEHTLAIRVVDRYDNAVSVKAVVR